MDSNHVPWTISGAISGWFICLAAGLAPASAVDWKSVSTNAYDFPLPVSEGVYAYGKQEHRVMLSVDQGVDWKAISPVVPDSLYPVAMAVAGGIFWLAARELGTFSWTPGQSEWSRANAGFPSDVDVGSMNSARGVALAGTNSGLWGWDASRQAWQSISESDSLLRGVPIYGIQAEGDLLILATNRGDAFLGRFQGGSYRWMESPMRWCYGLARKGNSLFAVCLGYPLPDGIHRVVRSDDEGATWTALDAGLPLREVFRNLAMVGGSLFVGIGPAAASADNPPPGVYRSEDAGQHWIPDTAGLPLGTLFGSMLAVGDTLLGVLTGGGVWIQPHAAPAAVRPRKAEPEGRSRTKPGWYAAPSGRDRKGYRITGRLENKPSW